MTLLDVAFVVMPVFGLIGIGFLAARTGFLSPGVGEGLSEFVVTLAIPVLVFRTIGTAHFPDQSPWPLWAAYFGGVVVAWAIGSRLATRLFRRSRAEGVIAGTSASFSNLVMVGTPLVVAGFGETGALPLFIILSVHLPIMMVAGTLMTERAVRIDRGDPEPMHLGRVLLRIGRNLAGNALVWGLAAGALWRLTGLALDGVPRTIIDHISAAGLPTALIALGMAMSRYGIVGEVRIATVLMAVKLVVMPICVFLLARYVFGLPHDWTAVATIAAACPPGVNSYLFAERFAVAQGTASSSIAVGTVLSVATIVLWFLVIAAT